MAIRVGRGIGIVPGAMQGLGLVGKLAKVTSIDCVASGAEPKYVVVESSPAGARWGGVIGEGGGCVMVISDAVCFEI